MIIIQASQQTWKIKHFRFSKLVNIFYFCGKSKKHSKNFHIFKYNCLYVHCYWIKINKRQCIKINAQKHNLDHFVFSILSLKFKKINKFFHQIVILYCFFFIFLIRLKHFSLKRHFSLFIFCNC
jgi:hypothetical protein